MAARQMWTSSLDWGLAVFSGDSAVDELYEGPFCVVSIVANHTCKRLLYQVLDHAPDHHDITAFLRRFQMALQLRSRALRGVTTEGSPLYPEPLRAVATVRKELAARKPRNTRGRPSTRTAQRTARHRERLQQKIGELFAHRYLFVQHALTPLERRTLPAITRGVPQLRRSARSWRKSTAYAIDGVARTLR